MLTSLKQQLRRFVSGGEVHADVKAPSGPPTDLRNSTEFAHIGPTGPLIEDLFLPARRISGVFNVDDCSHFHLVLTLQSVLGVQGDLFEIGSFHGRSTAVMAAYLKNDEKIIVCDAFQLDTEDAYVDKPSPQMLVENILRVNPDLGESRIVVHQCLSNDLSLDDDVKLRFAHVDGGHSEEQTYFDINLCKKHIIEKGLIVVDDYNHQEWPGVTPGVNRFLRENADFSVLADLNRHGALGRKIYLIRTTQN